MVREGATSLQMHEGDRLTDLAKEAARVNGIALVEAGQAPAAAPAAPAPVNAPAPVYTAAPGFAAPSAQLFGSPYQMPAPAIQASADRYDLVIYGGICVVPEMGCIRANVCVKGGKIAALTTDIPAARDAINANGRYVLPGIIDPHTHLGLFAPLEEELMSETRSAVLGGVTTIGTYFNFTDSYLGFLDTLDEKVNRLSMVDMIPHLTMRHEQHIAEMPQYSGRGMNSFKMYMCGVTGVFPNQDDGLIVEALKKMKGLPPWANPIMSFHCENEDICDYATDTTDPKTIKTLEDWNKTHPNLAEGEAVQRAAYFSKEIGVRAYVVHSSTKEAMELLPKVKHDKIFVETTSPYLCLDTKSDIGAYGKMLPPIREEASRLALWDALRGGYIDTIGTDNTVMTSEEKNIRGGMSGAGAGYPTLGTHMMSVLTEGIFKQEVPIEKLVPLMTMNPAKIFGVYPQKGTLMPGSDADIVVVDLEKEGIVRPENLLSRSDFSLFQGKKLRAWPSATVKAGRIVAFDGRLVDGYAGGRVLRH